MTELQQQALRACSSPPSRAAMPVPARYVFGLRVATRTSCTAMPMGSISE